MSYDGTACVWFTQVEDLLRLAEERLTRDLDPTYRERYEVFLEE